MMGQLVDELSHHNWFLNSKISSAAHSAHKSCDAAHQFGPRLYDDLWALWTEALEILLSQSSGSLCTKKSFY